MFAQQCGLDVDYRAIETAADDFSARVREFARQGGSGCNITAPLKHQAWSLAQRSSDSARVAKAANTLCFERSGSWYADNTDGRGLVRDLLVNLDYQLEGARICIIGAGGAVAGILGDLLKQKTRAIVIANRTLLRAQELQADLGRAVSAISLHELGQQPPFDLVINASSLGHAGEHPDLPLTLFRSTSLLYDLNYGPAAEPLAQFCGAHEITFENGLGMLVEQAALSFSLWTGHDPETKPVLRVLKEQ
jgi:shikimate dehydrogenase